MPLARAEQPFLFKTQLSLVLLTGRRATNVLELRNELKTASESSVYYHTHNFLQRHQFLIPEPSNDFAYWVTQVLREERLGERLEAIDTVRFTSLNELREAILTVMDAFLQKNATLREAPEGSEFHFMKAILFSFPTVHEACDLEEFLTGLKKVSIHSLYYHIFEWRLRASRGANDFSLWLQALGETSLARQIDRLDPYSHTMEELRSRIVRLIERRIGEKVHAAAG